VSGYVVGVPCAPLDHSLELFFGVIGELRFGGCTLESGSEGAQEFALLPLLDECFCGFCFAVVFGSADWLFYSALFFFPSEALGLCPVLAFAIGH
jgi:hypothetical protein